MADAASGTYGILRIEASLAGYTAPGNYYAVSWALYFLENGSTNQQFNGDGVPASVAFSSLGTIWAGSFTFDWRSGGNQNVLIASGTTNVSANPDGTPPAGFNVSGGIGDTGSNGAGHGASVAQAVGLPVLKVLPGTPTGLTATYVSDTQASLTWAQTSASNGQPTSNKIQKRVNGGAWVDVATISPTTSATVVVAANQKVEFQVNASNEAGSTAYSAVSAPVYTIPGTPTNVVAVKAGSDITITFDENVDYTEYNHEIWHGTVAGGVTTWDGSALITLASGVLTYTHAAPNPALVHVYRVRSKAGALVSAYAVSNTVQLLTAPAKPTYPATPPYADKASVFRFNWIHNPLDSSAQTKRQVRYSTDGGVNWTTGAKTSSTATFLDYAASTWVANTVVTFQVRTKGAYDVGSDGDASYSPWSDSLVVTFKTIPVATIVSPANASVYTDASLRVTLGFAQSEAAVFVKAQLELLQGATLLETLESTNLVGIALATPVLNGLGYTIRARVQDSNGLWSAWKSNAFTVTYLAPVPAVVTLTYLPTNGWGQIDLAIGAPGAGQAAATTVTITRKIDGVEEVIFQDYPVSSVLTFLDTIPTIHGTNIYTVTTRSALGAQSVTVATLITNELRRAYLSKSAGFSTVVVFGANLSVTESLDVAGDTVQASGRIKSIGLYGVETDVQVKVQSFIFEGFGSTVDQLRKILLVPGKACYRDASGRRVFGKVKGGLSYKKATRAIFSFTMSETS
jgi:hypothetical protein